MRKIKLSPEIVARINEMNEQLKPRNPQRIPLILDALRTIWEKYPDYRLGQLLENFVFLDGSRGEDKTSVALFAQEDDVTLQNLRKIIKERIINPTQTK